MDSDSTTERLGPRRAGPRPVWHRRIGVAILAIIVAAGAAGLLGVRSHTVTASAAGFTLTVTYAGVARSGLDVPLQITVEGPQDFSRDIELSITARYFDMYETQGFHPEPKQSRSDGRNITLTFDPPANSRIFQVDYDAYIQPASQIGADARIWLIQEGKPTVSVDISTFLFP